MPNYIEDFNIQLATTELKLVLQTFRVLLKKNAGWNWDSLQH